MGFFISSDFEVVVSSFSSYPNFLTTHVNKKSYPHAGMLDFETRGCDLRYTIIISFESSKGTGTGETNGVLEKILN